MSFDDHDRPRTPPPDPRTSAFPRPDDVVASQRRWPNHGQWWMHFADCDKPVLVTVFTDSAGYRCGAASNWISAPRMDDWTSKPLRWDAASLEARAVDPLLDSNVDIPLDRMAREFRKRAGRAFGLGRDGKADAARALARQIEEFEKKFGVDP